MVEPLPHWFAEGQAKHRRAWAVKTCLSTKTRPQTLLFDVVSSNGKIMPGLVNNRTGTSVEMQCFPLYSLLLALGNPKVDFLTLDIEGAELQVLKTIPWDKVKIRAISVETMWSGDVMEGSRADIQRYLAARGYSHLDSIGMDDLFVKLDDNGHSPAVTLEEVMTTSGHRLCQYLMVPRHLLAKHCKRMFPRFYFAEARVEDLPQCLKEDTTPYTWQWISATLGMPGYNAHGYLFCKHFQK